MAPFDRGYMDAKDGKRFAPTYTDDSQYSEYERGYDAARQDKKGTDK